MKIYTLILTSATILLVFLIILSFGLNSLTNYSVFAEKFTIFSLFLSFLTIIIIFGYLQKSKDNLQTLDQYGQKYFEKIKKILSDYFGKKKLDVEGLLNHLLPEIENIINTPYFKELPQNIRNLIYDIYFSSNPRRHGHFHSKRAERYLRQLAKELGYY